MVTLACTASNRDRPLSEIDCISPTYRFIVRCTRSDRKQEGLYTEQVQGIWREEY
jgi:hypothetical protein